MSKSDEMTHLEKAKGALVAAKAIKEKLDEKIEGSGDETAKSLLSDYLDMMEAARTQAAVAQADAMERMAFLAECQAGLRNIKERYKLPTHDARQAGYV